MKSKWSKQSLLVEILLLFAGAGIAQETFVQFTYYDQVRWSPDGRQLAFRCILLDEGRPEAVMANLLLKDLPSDQMMCLNPLPERFKISQDKKYLLFSSAYGLYLLSLETESAPALLFFREPTADWYWQEFGFYRDKKTIYIQRSDRTGRVIEENHRLKLSDAINSNIRWLKMKKLNKRMSAARFDLPSDELSQVFTLRIKDKLLKFEAETPPGTYRFVWQSWPQPSSSAVLIKGCRPRLISANPDSSEVIISVLEGGKHRTYRMLLGAATLVPLAEMRYLSVSWLDGRQYICLTDSGLFWRSIDAKVHRRLDVLPIPEWCHSVDLTLPQFEIQVGFEKDKLRAEKLIQKLQAEGYAARMKYVKDLSQQGYRVRVTGFKSRDEAREVGRQLQSRGYGFWIDALTDWYDYFNSLRAEERNVAGGQTAVVQYRLERYLRSRIVVIDANGKSRIAVAEMNTIPDRLNW